jgi:methionyl aminopeptidase
VLFTAEKDIQGMREAGRLASEVLDHVTPHVKAGITTGELDRICHAYMRDIQKTIPAPLNYQPPGYPPFPASILHISKRCDLPRDTRATKYSKMVMS